MTYTYRNFIILYFSIILVKFSLGAQGTWGEGGGLGLFYHTSLLVYVRDKNTNSR
jgi:hypothetical protein